VPPEQGEPRQEAERRPSLEAGAGGRLLVGTCSWTDRTLVQESNFYPKRSMRAEERLRYYASIFPLVEVDASYYFPPTEEMAGLWVERTPAGFTMSVKAYSLLTGHPTRPDSLWPEVADQVPVEHKEKRSVYLSHLPAEAVDASWELFRQALMPLHSAGKLGTVLFQFPPWFRPNSGNRRTLAGLQGRLPDYDLAVEFRHGSWLSDDERGRTLALLEREGLVFVCVDEPQGFDNSVPPLVAATADIAVVRFHGRNADTWEDRSLTAAERFAYRYDEGELAEWVPNLKRLASSARETHALMNNCYRDYAVDNGRQLAALFGEGLQPKAMAELT
jgi:uncharacterized protein YecE (DUF72 family)